MVCKEERGDNSFWYRNHGVEGVKGIDEWTAESESYEDRLIDNVRRRRKWVKVVSVIFPVSNNQVGPRHQCNSEIRRREEDGRSRTSIEEQLKVTRA